MTDLRTNGLLSQKKKKAQKSSVPGVYHFSPEVTTATKQTVPGQGRALSHRVQEELGGEIWALNTKKKICQRKTSQFFFFIIIIKQ